MLLAAYALEANLGKDAVEWATQQIVAGLDTPHLRRLAGYLGTENAFELEQEFQQTLRELGISIPEPEKAVLLYARELALEFLGGSLGREFVLRELSQLYIDTSYSVGLSRFYNLRWALDDIKEQGWSYYRSDVTTENFDETFRIEIVQFLQTTGESTAFSA